LLRVKKAPHAACTSRIRTAQAALVKSVCVCVCVCPGDRRPICDDDRWGGKQNIPHAEAAARRRHSKASRPPSRGLLCLVVQRSQPVGWSPGAFDLSVHICRGGVGGQRAIYETICCDLASRSHAATGVRRRHLTRPWTIVLHCLSARRPFVHCGSIERWKQVDTHDAPALSSLPRPRRRRVEVAERFALLFKTQKHK